MQTDNLIPNGDFSQGDKEWRIYLSPGSPAWAEIRDGYCHVKEGAAAEQTLELAAGTYYFSFECLFPEASKSYVNLALEMSGLRKQIDVRTGPDYLPYAMTFEVAAQQSGGPDLFSLALRGNQVGGKYRHVRLISID
jgi:hypothetical protein